ncbi:MAG: SAM-dependent methyltransferase [Bacilli bacterium]|nr:SAM-dependent methyltransferase [Bacilli bacterium]
MNKLSQRLEAIASFVPQGAYLADVGSDHALLPIALLERGVIPFAQAIDNKMAPYLRMKRNVEEAGWTNRVLCSLSSGLDDLSPNATAVAICGIGGLLTCDILEKGKEKLDAVETIILDPHRDLLAVRQRVSALGYHIEDEEMVYEGRIYYSIMKWKKGAPTLPYTEDELAFGPILLKKKPEIFLEYLKTQLGKINAILKDPLPKDKREHYLDLYRRIKAHLN